MGRPVKFMPLPDREYLTSRLDYDPDTGVMRWKERDASTFKGSSTRPPEIVSKHWASRYAGQAAGSIRPHGYHMTMIDGVHYMTHRLIWKIMVGDEPVEIDHIDGDRSNNRFSNLRSVEHVVNMKNKSLYLNNKSGFPGVEFHKRDCVWVAKIGVDGGQVQLGNFETKQEAVAARIAGEVMLDYHKNHGRAKQPLKEV